MQGKRAGIRSIKKLKVESYNGLKAFSFTVIDLKGDCHV
jgi:hypothetical protein